MSWHGCLSSRPGVLRVLCLSACFVFEHHLVFFSFLQNSKISFFLLQIEE